ncbi:MAG: hypothetical protein ABFR53_00325 [Actinomycetota bacterium]
MGWQAATDDRGVVLGALCRDGPVLKAFGVNTDGIQDGSASSVAIAFLRLLAGDTVATSSGSFAETRDSVLELVEPALGELDNLDLSALASWITSLDTPPAPDEAAERFWEVFAPDSAGVLDRWEQAVDALRSRRLVIVEDEPIDVTDTGSNSILFTANVLLTAPHGATVEQQRWFYDHPQIWGSGREANEIVHGLVGLDEAVAFEKERGTIAGDERIPIVLSVSVTHDSLEQDARDEVDRCVEMAGPLDNLAVYLFTEADARLLVNESLSPAIDADPGDLDVFGVSGAYGRHYSFLKAIAALWNVAIDPRINRTFKIDLDQVFPEQELVDETGLSAFELLSSPRWGAKATDTSGRRLALGMCAGALVNEADLDRGLLTADIDRPTSQPTLPDLLFRKSVTQALSTEAEMLDDGDTPQGAVRQRVHVTGGTTGITVDALRIYRPFTPSFISRAEDQAYILSVLGGPEPWLRTVHIPCLFMRHDKASVAAGAASGAAIDTAIGDYERTILFTGYARALEPVDTSWLSPFTGSYISRAPVAVTLIRLMIDVIDRSQHGDEAAASELLVRGVARIARAYGLALAPGNDLDRRIEQERLGWDRFYTAVEAIEHRPDLRDLARSIIKSTRLVQCFESESSSSPFWADG